MYGRFHIRNAIVVNEGHSLKADVLIEDGLIKSVIPAENQLTHQQTSGYEVIDAGGLYLLPGIIDDQVHFREPGLTHKGEIYTESKAAVAGGITSFMEMPNTIPNALTQSLLEEKYQRAAEVSLANYSFYMGASNNNLDEVVRTNPKTVCGIKVFMGSSTGNMLVDDQQVLQGIFAESPCLVAVHCEHEPTVQQQISYYRKLYGDDAPAHIHPLVRSDEACYLSSSQAVELAYRYNTRLHVLHLSTAREMSLFDSNKPLIDKRVTAEVCLHHLWFSDKDYATKGNLIKWNPSVKSATDLEALWQALADGKLDVIATDHAPHTLEEKNRPYFLSPSGGPMVQHLLPAMLTAVQQGRLTLEMLVQKMCHNPAIAFNLLGRGFVKEGYWADLVLVDPNRNWTVDRAGVLYKCGWSPMEGESLRGMVTHTFVNGKLVYHDGVFDETTKGQRLLFDR
ncbi:MAG: dihydroorotase [Bacteroidales bacterium]|nr:dihydroorotase [Bacteroidales bacterium]